jgi:hypothetical protein
MPSAPFALILQVSDTYLPSVHLLINGISAMPTGWKDSVQAEKMGAAGRGRAPRSGSPAVRMGPKTVMQE